MCKPNEVLHERGIQIYMKIIFLASQRKSQPMGRHAFKPFNLQVECCRFATINYLRIQIFILLYSFGVYQHLTEINCTIL